MLCATIYLHLPSENDDSELCSALLMVISRTIPATTRDNFDDLGRLTVSSLVDDVRARVFSRNLTSKAA